MIETILLGADPGLDLGFTRLNWNTRLGRSLRGVICTLAQTGFRKAEISVSRQQPFCDADCLARGGVHWFLRGRMYTPGTAPASYLLNPQPGDFAVVTPPPSKSDPFDMVWGGNPIWLPFQPNEHLCAFVALAADGSLYRPICAIDLLANGPQLQKGQSLLAMISRGPNWLSP